MRQFAGGTHPPEMKEMAGDKAVETFPVPEEVVVPLQQHIGAPAVAGVQKGDEVRVGSVIGEAGGFVSARVHSPVSGKVRAIERTLHPLGKRVTGVRITNDGNDTPEDGVGQESSNWRSIGGREIVEKIQAAGIVGMGGATFPAHVKLSPPDNKPIDTIIINGAECEPFLTCDYRLLLERTGEVIEGAQLVRRTLEKNGRLPAGIIAIEANKKDAYEKVKAAVAEYDGLDAVLMPVRYPQGAEKQLIKTVLNREVPPQSQRGLPMDVGVVVQNVGTAVAIYEAVRFNRPLYQRTLTVSGDGVGTPGNLLVRIGTPAETILQSRGLNGRTRKVINGGPMMGIALSDLSIPVNKGTSGLLAFLSAGEWETRPCISCGRCVRGCPMFLVPSKYSTLGDAGLYEETERWNVVDCIECGVCTYVCPAKRPIVHHVKVAKSIVIPLMRARQEAQKQKSVEKKEEKE